MSAISGPLSCLQPFSKGYSPSKVSIDGSLRRTGPHQHLTSTHWSYFHPSPLFESLDPHSWEEHQCFSSIVPPPKRRMWSRTRLVLSVFLGFNVNLWITPVVNAKEDVDGEIQRVFMKGRQNEANGFIDEAQELYEQVVQTDPDFV